MTKPENIEEIIDRTIDLKSFDNEDDIRIKLKESKNKTDRIRSGLVELKIMKIDTKRLQEEIVLELLSLKEKERMARFKIKEIKELEIKLKELKSRN